MNTSIQILALSISIILLILMSPTLMAQSPGIQVGTTWYEYQTNGSTGNRIGVGLDGDVIMCWHNLYGWPIEENERHIHYARFNSDGVMLDSARIDPGINGGYTTMDIIYNNRAAIVYHSTWGSNATYVTLAHDGNQMEPGDFEIFDPPDSVWPATPEYPGRMMWPYVAVDRSHNIHIVMNENTPFSPQRSGYTRSENGGVTWIYPVVIDTAMVISTVIDASPVSDRVVIGYCKASSFDTRWKNDIVYYSSDDGLTWDFESGPFNITNYIEDSDSLWAYTDMDIIIDYDDNVHAVWNARPIDDDGLHNPIYLYHYSEATGEITEITHHPEIDYWMDIGGTWNLAICKMNMGVHDIDEGPDGVFVTWTQFDTSDVSAGGYGNGEIYMSYTIDNGATWSDPENLTNTPTSDCLPGDCDNDNWSSLADVVNDYLHIIYPNDKDPAASNKEEGTPQENPVMYLRIPNPLVTFAENRESLLPKRLSLSQNYPNPFNAKTIIPFEINRAGAVSLEVFDLTGAKVARLVDNYLTPGYYKVTWNAESVSSGVYYFKLKTDDGIQTKKGVLIK